MYKRIQLLSLDVVLGALGCGVMAAYLLEVQLPEIWWICFPIAVWVLYTADHLLDAARLGEHATSERHRYHVRCFRPISIIWLLLTGCCLFLFPWVVPRAYLWLAIAAGAIAAIHFWLVWLVRDRVTPWLAKEVGVALVYTCGVWGGSVVLAPEPADWKLILVMTQFFFLALINLLTFGVYEELSDEQDGFTSWARGLGNKMSHRILLTMAFAIGMIGGFVLFFWSGSEKIWFVEGVYGLMGALLIWVARDPRKFSVNDRYRAIADGVFLIPLIWIPFYLIEVYGTSP